MFNISFTLADRARHVGRPRADRRDRPRRDARDAGLDHRRRRGRGRHGAPAGRRRPTAPVVHVVLRRRPGDEPAEWVRVHAPARGGKSSGAPGDAPIASRSRPGDQTFGSIWVAAATRARRPGPRRDARPGRRGRPDRRRARARPAPARGDVRRDLATERRPEVRAARLGVARPADAARLDPRRRRDADGPGRRLAAGAAPRDRRVDRP